MGKSSRRKRLRLTQCDVNQRELIDAVKKGLLGGVYRGLDLQRRLGDRFRERGWDPNPELIACAAVAIGLCRLNAGVQAVRVPVIHASGVDTWRGLPNITSAGYIVTTLGLEDLMQPPEGREVVL